MDRRHCGVAGNRTRVREVPFKSSFTCVVDLRATDSSWRQGAGASTTVLWFDSQPDSVLRIYPVWVDTDVAARALATSVAQAAIRS